MEIRRRVAIDTSELRDILSSWQSLQISVTVSSDSESQGTLLALPAQLIQDFVALRDANSFVAYLADSSRAQGLYVPGGSSRGYWSSQAIPIRKATRGYAVVPYTDIVFPAFAHRERLGRGTYGTVDKAFYNGRAVAAKRMEANVALVQIHKEADLLHKLRHENIVKLLALFQGEKNGLVLELMEGGSLHELLHQRHELMYFECHVLGWAQQVTAALSYIHRNGYLHRDLKPSNTLLTDDFRTLKLCDFGTVTKLRACMTNNCGSPYWMAPEVFRDKHYDQKCDMFSFGVLLWEIIARRQPYSEQDFDNVYMFLNRVVVHGLRPPRISNCPAPITELIERCWQHNASERPDVEEVVGIIDILCELCPDRYRPLVDTTTKQQSFAQPTEQPSSSCNSPGHFYSPEKQVGRESKC